MVKLGGWNFGFEAFEKPEKDGLKYKKAKTFYGKRGKQKAEEYADKLRGGKITSRRTNLQPIIQKVPIGWKLGYIYRVCIPK
jgi:hypothetical protein